MKTCLGGYAAGAALCGLLNAAWAVEPCRIEVVEQGSGWPVPLVELRTTHQVRFVTDNAGVIAFDLPEMMGRETWFDVQGKEWVLFGDPLPKLRCPATFEAWQDPATWETLEPQKALVSASDGQPVKPHTGSIAWNGFRKRWVTVFMQNFGKPSVFGELWYAEADAPIGPWGKAVKVLSHDNYTFYNPRLHPEVTPPASPILLFEGSYTAEFANHPPKTPRYDYTQILYRLDLDDPALAPARKE